MSIVKAIDKVSGTDTRSKNIEDAVKKLELGGGAGGEVGYRCTETMEELFEETVTTEVDGDIAAANLFYSELITAEKLTIIFNGTQYVCPKITSHGVVFYGGANEAGDFDFTNYPFCISSMSGANVITTESPMTVTVGVSAISLSVETTECFRRAVASVLTSISENGGK